MTFSLEASTVSGTVASVGDCAVNFAGHAQQGELAFHVVTRAMLAGVSCQVLVMGEMEKAWKRRLWHHSLYNTIKQGGEN